MEFYFVAAFLRPCAVAEVVSPSVFSEVHLIQFPAGRWWENAYIMLDWGRPLELSDIA